MNAGEGILLICPGCSHEFRVGRGLVGRKMPCPHCLRPITVREVGTATVDRLIGRKVGGCRLTKRLGAGALGLVYQGEDLSDGRIVAVKMLGPRQSGDPQVVQRFMREARLCAQINHPHVVRVFDCGFDHGVNYLVMEMVEGGTLAGILEERGKLPWAESLRYVRDVASALVRAAEANIVHRDIKPANILITADGRAKLADLGLAKQHDDSGGGGNELTMQGMAIGSPAYMSPEQATNAKDARAPSDIYGLGATWYHLLSGKRPFTGINGQDVLSKVLHESPPPLPQLVPGIPVGIADLVARMMDRDWRRRPQTAAALLVELDAVAERPDKAATARIRRPAQAVPSASAWLLPAIIAVVALLVVGMTAWLVLRR